MSKPPVFIFGTPEGGSVDVKMFLEMEGYRIVGNPDIHLKSLWDFVDLGSKTKSGLLGPGASELLKRFYFEEDDLPENFGFVDNFVGMNYGYGFKMWMFLVNNIPNAKIVFAYLPLDVNMARLMATNKKWIPSYGSCPSNCEARVKSQISQFEEFASFFPDNSLIFNTKDASFQELLEFVK